MRVSARGTVVVNFLTYCRERGSGFKDDARSAEPRNGSPDRVVSEGRKFGDSENEEIGRGEVVV